MVLGRSQQYTKQDFSTVKSSLLNIQYMIQAKLEKENDAENKQQTSSCKIRYLLTFFFEAE